jgi:hypothetical protein
VHIRNGILENLELSKVQKNSRNRKVQGFPASNLPKKKKKAFRQNLNRLYTSYLVKVGSYNLMGMPLFQFVRSPKKSH